MTQVKQYLGAYSVEIQQQVTELLETERTGNSTTEAGGRSPPKTNTSSKPAHSVWSN
ncbi:hypothetical protein [Marinomonas piezotolerans]|uniref:hypothetical protein n=1 Tax=Marinomonas piezotolerans TaxID=2213058 RepID=UPI001313E7A6|nr:hypothetical protein [Marinomonas piezotolerans]